MQALFRSWTVGVGLAVASFVVLTLAVSDPPLHFDTITDYLIARDCVELLDCGSHAHSVLGLRGGRTVVYLLLLGQAIDVGPDGTLLLAHVLNALSVLVVWYTARRYIDATAALPAAIAALGTVLWLTGLPMLWNPTMAPLPLALCFLFIVAFVNGDRLRDAFFAGAMIGAAMSAHQICVVLVPLSWFVLQLVSDRPNLSVLANFAGLGASTLVLDYPVTIENLDRLAIAGLLAPTGLGLCAAIIAGLFMRRHASRLSRATLGHAWILAVLMVGLAGSAALSVFLGAGVELRYLVAVAPALPLAVGWLVWRGGRLLSPKRRPIFVIAAAALAVVVVENATDDIRQKFEEPTTFEPLWTMTEGVEVAELLRGADLDLAGSHSHLLEVKGRDLRPMFAIAASRSTTRPGPDAPVFFVARPVEEARGALGSYRVVQLSTGRPALIGTYRPWVVPDTYAVCIGPPGRPVEGACVDVTSESYAPLADTRRRASQLRHLTVPDVGDALKRVREDDDGALTARYELRIEPREQTARIAHLMTAGRIVTTSNGSISEDGRRATLQSGGRSSLVVEITAPVGNDAPLLSVPALLELQAGEEEVEAWLDTVRQSP